MCILAVSILSVSAPQTFAMAKAIFPDSRKLQPAPTNTRANISGSTNSSNDFWPAPNETSTTQSTDITTNTETPITEGDENTATQEDSTSSTGKVSGGTLLSVLGGIVVGIAVLAFYIRRKIRQGI